MNKNFNKRLHSAIPGGAHTYSRGDDQFPQNAPSILLSSKGSYATGPNKDKYLDYGMGLRSVTIGYANKEIATACFNELMKGNNLSRPSLTELLAAELLIDLIPSVEMVKFAKHGSTVTTAAVKLARAYTSRKLIAVPEEQPFFSFDDWFIGSTQVDRGIPEETKAMTIKFKYNDKKSLLDLFDKYPNQIAAVILEPATHLSPCLNNCEKDLACLGCAYKKDNFLHFVQNICKKNGALFILDEMITGFRWHLNGAQTFFGVEPDLCTFGKAMGNGIALAALGGKREIMSIAGILDEGKERVFLTSSTHGAEMGALGAFIKTIEIYKRENVIEYIWEYGRKLKNGMNQIAKELGINEYFYVEGFPCLPNYVTLNLEKKVSLELRTLFSQEMISLGILMPYISISFSHKQPELEKTLKATKKALIVYKLALKGDINLYLKSKVIKPVFRKFN